MASITTVQIVQEMNKVFAPGWVAPFGQKGIYGHGYLYLRGRVWWMQVRRAGTRIRRSTKETERALAERKLRQLVSYNLPNDTQAVSHNLQCP